MDRVKWSLAVKLYERTGYGNRTQHHIIHSFSWHLRKKIKIITMAFTIKYSG